MIDNITKQHVRTSVLILAVKNYKLFEKKWYHRNGLFTLPHSDSDFDSNHIETLHCAEVYTLHGV